MSDPSRTISFQGRPGAYSDLACRSAYPRMRTLPCASFDEAFAAVQKGRARLAMIPIENSLAGRVADIHHLLPKAGLYIVGEHFLRTSVARVAALSVENQGLTGPQPRQRIQRMPSRVG